MGGTLADVGLVGRACVGTCFFAASYLSRTLGPTHPPILCFMTRYEHGRRVDSSAPDVASPVVDVVVPVYNEDAALASERPAAPRLPDRSIPVLVADHDRRQRVDRRHLGRGRLRSHVNCLTCERCTSTARAAGWRCARAWIASDAAVVAYMDVDLSTDLDALLPLVAPLVSGHSDVAIGSRLAPGASVRAAIQARGHLAGYNLMLALVFAHAGARRAVRLQGRAGRRRAARSCPRSRTTAGSSTPSCSCSPSTTACASTRSPVDWVDDPDSRVQIVRTALGDLKGMARMFGEFAGHGRVDVPRRRGAQRERRDDRAHGPLPHGVGRYDPAQPR